MRNSITFYIDDAREWDEAGMTQADQDALVLGLWHWASGKPSTEGMSVVTKALYLNYIGRESPKIDYGERVVSRLHFCKPISFLDEDKRQAKRFNVHPFCTVELREPPEDWFDEDDAEE